MQKMKTKLTRRERLAAERAAAPPASATRGDETGLFSADLRRDALAGLALGLLVATSYFPALLGGFIWDDVLCITEEPVVLKPSGLWNIWFSPADLKKEAHYWPIVYTSFWLEHKLWGLAPLGYHLVNVLLHLVNVLLVWRLLLRLTVPGAWVVAAVFAVHPLHVESVAWIIERKDLLSTLFYLTAVLTWMRFVETPGWGRYLLALALFTAGLLSKSVVVTLPAALLLWHWWQRERVTVTDLRRLAPFFVVGLCITAADLAFSFYTSREPLDLGYSIIERVLIAARALWFYLGKLLWPTDLAVIYPLWDIRAGDPLAWAYVVAAVAVAALLWFGRHRMGRGPLAGALFFAVTLSPVLGFVDYGYMLFAFVADRFQYLAGIGVMAVLIGAAVHGAGKLPGWGKWAGGALAVVIVVLLGTLTWRQAGIYRDQITFFSHIVSLNPDARDAHLNLGYALFKADRPEEALAATRLAVEKRPDSATAHSNLGLVLFHLERFDETEEHLRRALKLNPRHRNARQNMAETLKKQKRYEEAVAAYRAVLKLDPKDAAAHAGLGDALFHLDRHEEAVAALEQSLALQPDSPIAATLHVRLGQALRKLDRLEAAAKQYERALAIDPRDSRFLAELANLRVAQGRAEEADEYLRRVRELHPRDPATLQKVAEALRKQKRYEEALVAYRAVLDVDPDFALAHAGLGDALFHLDRHEEAVAALEQALALQPDSPVAGKLHVLWGQALQKLDQIEAAAEQYEHALALDPGDSGLLLALANLRGAQGRADEANEYLRRARELEPRDPATLQNVAEALRKQNRYEDALAAYRAVLDVDPDFALAHAGLGDALFHLKRYEEALDSLARSLALEPESPTTATRYVLMGQTAQALNRPEAAVEYFERALATDPHHPGSVDYLARLRFGQKRYQESLALFQKLLEMTPDNAQAHANLGATLYYLGRPKEALRSFERALALDPNLTATRTGLEKARKILRQRGQQGRDKNGETEG